MKHRSPLILLICITLSALISAISCRPAVEEDAVAGTKNTSETPDSIHDQAEALLAAMTVSEKIGQLLFIDLWNDGQPAVALTESLIRELEAIEPGGVVFYGANMRSPSQVRKLANSIAATLRIPPFLAIDHEGGIVNRLDDSGEIMATTIPAAAEVGKTGIPELAYAIGVVMGREISSLGLNMNFAPVADLFSSDSMMGSRSFGDDPALVAPMVANTVAGLQQAGVSSVLKHFPGHGGAAGDTHSEAVYLDKKIDELFEHELLPFAAGVGAKADGVMTGHIIVGAPGSANLPATVSPDLLTGILRERFRYDGLIITDSLTMGALAMVTRPAVEAIRAGADMLLTPGNELDAQAQILAALKDGLLQPERIDESVLRIIRVKLKRGVGKNLMVAPPEALGCEAHAHIASLIQRFHTSGE